MTDILIRCVNLSGRLADLLPAVPASIAVSRLPAALSSRSCTVPHLVHLRTRSAMLWVSAVAARYRH
jgi:hypothetical protein